MTEEEAKGLLCPMSFNRSGEAAWRCIGSECMAWRWMHGGATHKTEEVYAEEPPGPEWVRAFPRPDFGLPTRGETRWLRNVTVEPQGYCGLAGKPE